jgi:hypothetical protein
MSRLLPPRIVVHLPAVAVCLLAAALVGCNGPLGWFGSVVVGKPVKATFEPVDLPTLVLVDQERDAEGPILRDPGLSTTIAARVGFILKDRGVISKTIDQPQLRALQDQVGARFDTMAAQDIGRRLDAQQVLQVHVIRANIAGLVSLGDAYRPWAIVQVRLLDVKTGACLFPPADKLTGLDARGREPTYDITAQTEHKSNPDQRQVSAAVLQSELADRIARDVARIFHSYNLEDPGEGDASTP